MKIFVVFWPFFSVVPILKCTLNLFQVSPCCYFNMLKNLSQGGKHWSLFDKENTNLTCCICIESSSLPCCLDKWLYGMLILIHQLVIQCVKSACRVSDAASRSQYIYRCAELLTDSKSYVWSHNIISPVKWQALWRKMLPVLWTEIYQICSGCSR